MFPTTFLITLLLAFAIAGTPVQQLDRPLITLPISRRLNFTSVHNLVRHDQARAKSLKQKGSKIAGRAVINEAIDNLALVYVANVGIGSPATQYSLLVDTGSSITCLSPDISYIKTGTSVNTGNTVSVTSVSGTFSGTEFTDTVSLGNGLTVTKQPICVASTDTGFDGVDGVLGLGRTTSAIPTIVDKLFSEGIISAHSIAISFEPTTVDEVINGEITWGGTDSTKFTGAITFIPVTTTSPASEFWGINQSIRYGASTTILASTAGIVDSGTSLILIATDAYTKYKAATGAVFDSTTGLLRLSTTQFSALQSLFFSTGGTTFELTANAQLWPRSLNTIIGGVSSSIYLVVNDLGSNSGEGLDFINGYTFLERFYSVFDSANNRVGLATTPFTTATTN